MVNKDAPSELIRAKDVSAFDRWALPSFDPEGALAVVEEPAEATGETATSSEPEAASQSEDVPLETVKPLTLDELEMIRQEAYNEGFATGEKDGFHAGQLKAKQEADAALNAKLASLELLMTQLLEPIAEQDQQLELALVNLVSHMSRQVIQRELSTDSSQIRQVLREALKLLPMGADNVRIHINPQDFDVVKALRERHEETWRILEDEALQAGGCRVETEHSQIDASIETRLAQALKQLFEQQREQATHPAAADIRLDLAASQEPPHAP
ncbi:flagellar assembly protein FliH [Pseudomonas cavernicola]|uniref:Flagellar assembly protein FliH n=1 Tax=Pseudomonas cavernicola TaxID=2320866 RepID=A0A418XBZ8_9PSED|nr:flagellar assembly protein FliH [Pseudomonas cavernicola]RJG09853.1 flagellar assembly protein FliH [Pseudomonas cavernicola]